MIKGRLKSGLKQGLQKRGIFGRRVVRVAQLVKDGVLEQGVVPAAVQIAKDEEGRSRLRRGVGCTNSFTFKADDRANGRDELSGGAAQRVRQNPGDLGGFVDDG